MIALVIVEVESVEEVLVGVPVLRVTVLRVTVEVGSSEIVVFPVTVLVLE